jgi:hypothetical protein
VTRIDARATLPALPRRVESDPRAHDVRGLLAQGAAPLWARAEIVVPRLPRTPALDAALVRARDAGHLRRGLEGAAAALDAQRRGLLPGQDVRVSRLLVCAADGSERFYRTVERTLRAHAPRVLGLVLDADAGALGRLLLDDPDATLRCVLVEHKDAVADVLLAVAGPAGGVLRS